MITYMVTLKQTRLALASLLILLSSVVAIPFMSTPVLAAPANVSDASVKVGYYYALRQCIAEAMVSTSEFTTEELNQQLYLGNRGVALGAQFITDDGDWDGRDDCSTSADKASGDDPSWVGDALKAFGYSDHRDFICHLMNPSTDQRTVTNRNSCKNGQGSLDISSLSNRTFDSKRAAFDAAVGQKVFDSTTPLSENYGPATFQNVLYTSFIKFCQPQPHNGGSVGNDMRQVAIKKYDPASRTYKDVQFVYSASRENMSTHVIEANPYDIPSKISCKDFPGNISLAADLAQARVDSVPESFMTNVNTGSIEGEVGGGDETSSCAIDGIGWIICPVMGFMADIVDGAYTIVSELLTTQPLNIDINDDENGTYQAWEIMRNLANVAFVIAFLIIIFSQLTSMGIGNYGIKKMLPRLVVAAILVNVSFYLCAIAIDLSNIIGASMRQLFDSLGGQISTPTFNDDFKTGEGWVGIVGFLLAGGLATGIGLAAGLSILLPALIAALVAIVTVFLVLTLRQALIIILIVISPLAFVAFLLPNTENLFSKWRTLLVTLLLMFPIIAIIFGASALASKVVMASEVASFPVQVMGALIAIIPLFVTPVVMKTAGGLLNRFGGVINNPNKGPFDRMRKGAEGVRKREQNRMNNKAFNSTRRFSPRRAFQRRNARIEAIDQNQQREFTRGKTDYIAEETANNNVGTAQQTLSTISGGRLGGKGLRDQMTAGGTEGAINRAEGSAEIVRSKLEAEEVSAATAIIKNFDRNALRTLSLGGNANGLDATNDLSLQTAAMQQIVNSGDTKGVRDMIDSSLSWDNQKQIALSDVLKDSSERPAFATQGELAAMKQGQQSSSTTMIENAIKDNVYSASKIASTPKDELNVIAETASTSTNLTISHKQKLVNNAHEALTDPRLATSIAKNLENVTAIRNNTPPPKGPLA